MKNKTEKIKHLFICSTPLQLITAINLRYNDLVNDDVTVYITDHNHLFKEMYKNAINSNCFTQVYLIKAMSYTNNMHWMLNYRITAYLYRGYEYLNLDRISSGFIKDDTIYDHFWVSFMDQSFWYMYLSYNKRNSQLKLSFFEDGTGTYTLLTQKQNKLDKRLSYMFGGKALMESIESLYVYEPSLVINTLYPDVKIKRLKKITDKKVRSQIEKVFPVTSDDRKLLESKYIFFESAYSSKKIQAEQLAVISWLSDFLGNSFCLKLHPATVMDKNKIIGLVFETNIPIEVFCLNNDISKNIFISIYSTANLTPQLMFDQSPNVIFLYKIVKLDSMCRFGEYHYSFIESFVDKYKGANIIFIPETIEELESILLQLEENK